MKLRHIPGDINVELLLSYFPEGMLKVIMRGMHKRNTYNDIIDIEEQKDGTIHVGIGRNGLYNTLPEYMFHPIDRFENLPKLEEKEKFTEEYEKQEQEKINAYKLFAPIDLLLLIIRSDMREALHDSIEADNVLIRIIGDELSDQQKTNRFIRQGMAFLPLCKTIRGNSTLLSFFIRKVFKEEGINIEAVKGPKQFEDLRPRYNFQVGSPLDSCYAGNAFDEAVTVFKIHYWSEDDCDEHFLKFIDEIEEFKLFVQDYFMSIDEILQFNVYKNDTPLRLSDDILYNYLNYNTNI